MYSLRQECLTITAIPITAIPPPLSPSLPHHCHCDRLSQSRSCVSCLGWWGGRVLHAVLASQWVGGGRVLHAMLGQRHSGACARWVGVMAGLACHVGMASRWGFHVVSRCHGRSCVPCWGSIVVCWHCGGLACHDGMASGRVLHAMTGWQWGWSCMR